MKEGFKANDIMNDRKQGVMFYVLLVVCVASIVLWFSGVFQDWLILFGEMLIGRPLVRDAWYTRFSSMSLSVVLFFLTVPLYFLKASPFAVLGLFSGILCRKYPRVVLSALSYLVAIYQAYVHTRFTSTTRAGIVPTRFRYKAFFTSSVICSAVKRLSRSTSFAL